MFSNKKKSVLILTLIIIFLYDCISSESSSIDNDDKDSSNNSPEILNSIAKSKFENNYVLIYNPSKDFVICKKVNKEEIPGYQLLNFFLFDLIKGKIIFEDRVPNGNIYWQSDHVVKIEEIPGIIQKDVSVPIPGYKYDVNKRKKL